MPVRTSPTTAAARSRTDLDLLQGAWVTIAGRRPVRLLIAGKRYALEFEDGVIYMGTIDLDKSSRPTRMDMTIEEGPEKHRDLVAHCIYLIESDILHWCPARLGSDHRLAEFPSIDDDRYISSVFRHVRRRN